MRVATEDVVRVFDKLGVEVSETGDLVAGWLVIEDRLVLALHYVRGREFLAGNCALRLHEQLRVDEAEFQLLVDCPMSREEYISLLGERGAL